MPAAKEYSNFYSLVNYLGLTEEIVVPQLKDQIYIIACTSNICLSDNDLVAQHLGKTSGYLGFSETKNRDLLNYFMREEFYENGCTQWRFKVISMGLFDDGPVCMNGDYTKPIWRCEGAFGCDANSAWQNRKCMSDDPIDPVIPISHIRVGTTHVLTFNLIRCVYHFRMANRQRA